MKDIKFNISDVFKLTGFLAVTISMWYDLKTDFEVHIKSHELLEYRMNKLEQDDPKYTGSLFVKPEDIQVKRRR